MKLIHLHILTVMLANLDFPLSSAYPVLYNGVSDQDAGFTNVYPDLDLGLEAGYGYVYNEDDDVSYNLRCYDFFAYLYDTWNGNPGITATAGSGFSYLSNASYLTLMNDNIIAQHANPMIGGFNGDNQSYTSVHLIIPDPTYVRSFEVSLNVAGGYNNTVYWEHRIINLDDLYLFDGNSLGYISWADMKVDAFGQYDYTDIYVPNNYAIVFYHVYPGVVNNGSPYYYGYEVENIILYNSQVPGDWGAENLLTLFGYLFIGMSAIFSIVVFPGLTLGTILLFPLALGILGLIWKLAGN